MARSCITENSECPHAQHGKRPCALLKNKFTLGKNMPQTFCPIQGGHGASVEFNYKNLAKFEPQGRWNDLIKAESCNLNQGCD